MLQDIYLIVRPAPSGKLVFVIHGAIEKNFAADSVEFPIFRVMVLAHAGQGTVLLVERHEIHGPDTARKFHEPRIVRR